MALLTWDATYSVNVSKCDDDHKKLFSILNALYDAMKAGKGRDVLEQIVKELADYTRYHFAAEEALLTKAKYPNLASHKEEHAIFIKKVEEFQTALKAGNMSQSMAVREFLKDWLANHIQQSDRQYSAHLNACGIS